MFGPPRSVFGGDLDLFSISTQNMRFGAKLIFWWRISLTAISLHFSLIDTLFGFVHFSRPKAVCFWASDSEVSIWSRLAARNRLSINFGWELPCLFELLLHYPCTALLVWALPLPCSSTTSLFAVQPSEWEPHWNTLHCKQLNTAALLLKCVVTFPGSQGHICKMFSPSCLFLSHMLQWSGCCQISLSHNKSTFTFANTALCIYCDVLLKMF